VSDTPPAPPGDGGPGDGGTARSFSGGSPLNGNVVVPGDKSISHRALLLAALAEGESTITGLSTGDDVARTLQAIEALGAGVTSAGGTVTVRGGRSGLHAPDGPLDLGNSGTGMRLLAGVVATLAGTTVLTGDDSLRGRPMDRVAEPLRLMGATVGGQGERCLPPVTISGGDLHGIEYTPPMASAQVKSAILLAGLAAGGETVVHEPVATRPHTEDMLAAAGAEIDVEWDGGAKVIRVRRSDLACGAYTVPGDPSQAAFWTVAAAIIPGSLVTVEGIALSPERLGFVGVLRRMGASIEVDEHDDGTGSVTGYTCALHGTDVEASEIPSLDEVPILAVAAATALGTTRFRDVGELRVKESDRLAGTADLVRAFGGRATVDGDELVVEGTGSPLRPARIDALGDHRMAMAAAVAGAACAAGSGPTVVDGWDAVDTSYPGFAEELDRLRAPGTVQW
jgi:3-phosphoshikimate 1-carboxyvinyltransferase